MSKLYAYSRTMAGAQRLAQQRGQPIAAIEAVREEIALVAVSVASNVLRFRRPAIAYETRRMSSPADFRKAKHLAFLADLHIANSTPYSVLIARVAAWHGFTAEQMIEPCRKRDRIAARADCIFAVKQAYPKASLPKLGQIFGGRDHTTILHYLRKRGQT